MFSERLFIRIPIKWQLFKSSFRFFFVPKTHLEIKNKEYFYAILSLNIQRWLILTKLQTKTKQKIIQRGFNDKAKDKKYITAKTKGINLFYDNNHKFSKFKDITKFKRLSLDLCIRSWVIFIRKLWILKA